jgi:hypothetical protein
LAQWEQFEKEENKKEGRQNEKKALTLTGLLMEGLRVSTAICVGLPEAVRGRAEAYTNSRRVIPTYV